jgi:hypothetical protein
MIGRATILLCLAVGLAACGEKPQTAGGKKVDVPAYEGTQTDPFVANGWKAGDKNSWEAQLKQRGQRGQNEYNRTAAVPTEAKSQ